MFEELKMEVVRVAKDADRSGMCRHKSGNFSIRDAETGLVVVSPSGVAREILKPEDCMRLHTIQKRYRQPQNTVRDLMQGQNEKHKDL